MQAGLEVLRPGSSSILPNSSGSSSGSNNSNSTTARRGPLSVEVHFQVQYGCEFGQHLSIISGLHSWHVPSAVPMTWSQGNTWNAVLSVPVG
jgi:hypothetical protein